MSENIRYVGYSCPRCDNIRSIKLSAREAGNLYGIFECPDCGTLTSLIDVGDKYGTMTDLKDLSDDYIIYPEKMVELQNIDGDFKAFYEFILAERLTKTAERSGNACHVYVPKSWEGDRVVVYRKPAVDQ